MIKILILEASGLNVVRPSRRKYAQPVVKARNRVQALFDRLHAEYGPQGWWPSESRFEMIVGAILTQRTAWRNAAQAVQRLAQSGWLSVEAMHGVPVGHLVEAIRAAGFYHMKARRLKGVAQHLIEQHDGSIDRLFLLPTGVLRDELLGLSGIGEETADAILVYAARRPSFVVDSYTRRLLRRLGWISGKEPYGELRDLFLDALPPDGTMLGEYHALIVQHGKTCCRVAPICHGCPLRSICPAGEAVLKVEG